MRSNRVRRQRTAVLVGGGVAATLDLFYAFVASNARAGRSPQEVLRSVASGWLGADAFDSGSSAALLGLVSHYAILFVAAGLYVAASRRVTWIRTHALLSGAAFGVGIYLFMNFVVLPLSAFPFSPRYPWPRLLEGFVSHGVLVGLPIALAARRWNDGSQLPA